ncbi:lamin tail domain-containing protein, partial [Flavobacteriales bacterium]|nr:lamin tail domain-containing protein [Flavobacteriales bacterium]
DDFSDGDFSANPIWEGIPGDFIVNPDEQLQLTNTSPTGADVSFVTTTFGSIALDEKEWQFWIKQSFSGSANNYGRFWLVSNVINPTTVPTEGYYLQFGELGSDDAIELFYSNSGLATSICRGTDGLISGSFDMRVRVRRDAVGLWTVDIDENGGDEFVFHASGTNTTVSSTDRVGIECKYTSSNADNFYYDDIYFGDYILDVTAPQIVSITATSLNEVDVLFNEPIDQTTAEMLTNYNADGGLGLPSSATLDGANSSLVHLTFATAFTNGTTYFLNVSFVEDLSGNVMAGAVLPFTYVETSPAGFRDIVINEFMCDPTPFVGLADAEFIEVFNASSNYVDLTGWKIGDASSTGTIGSHIIGPSEYALLIATADTVPFAFYNNVVTVTSFPSLNNAGDDIVLLDTGENIIDQLSYDLTWYQDPDKEDGGYTIEQINPFASCTNPSNWIGSANPLGGTPSAENSAYDNTPDVTGPALLGVTIISSSEIELELSEALDAGTVSASSVFLDPLVGISSATAIAPANQNISVVFDAPIDTGVVYTATITGINDCEGNPQTVDSTASFILPFEADSGSFVINEVLFNPFTGGSDYVEIVNVTNRPLNLKGWQLANYDEEDGLSNHKVITEEIYTVEAGGYVLVTEDTTDVMMNYIQHGVNNFIEADMPSYNNDSGTVYLLKPDSALAEFFSYDEDMHFPLLSTVDGVSLERLDIARDVNDMGNWHSAAETVGFGTPGLENSQYYPTSGAMGEVSADPEIFSPDNDGYNDILNINFSFTEPGLVGTIRIYDSNGRDVRELATNELLGLTGTFTWDGTTDKGEKARIGAYVILFEAFNTSGDVSRYKFTTILGGRL